MKPCIIFILLFAPYWSFSQEWEYDITFDDSSQFFRITIDTLSNPSNIWQIGPPQKTNFNSANSFPNVMITDTVNAYPSNDTSAFIITHIANDGFIWPHTVVVSGFYKSDCDSLNDFGLIEFSPDQGQTWINIVNDTLYDPYLWWGTPKPALTGKVLEWTEFYVNIAELGTLFNIEFGDTLYYRFTFISDGLANPGDGLMYDNLHFEDWWELTEEYRQTGIETMIYPNPATENVTLSFENTFKQQHELVISNPDGKILLSAVIQNNQFKLSTIGFTPGIYSFRLKNLETQRKSSGKMIIIHNSH